MTATDLDLEAHLGELSARQPLSAALVDIDEFAAINTAYGREVGDAVIQLVTETLQKNLPEDGVLVRTGGDEFACLLPRTSPEEALILLDEVRQHLAARPHRFGSGSFPLSISVGVATLPQHVSRPQQLVAAADAALHRAKQEGRGRVAIHVEEKMVMKASYYPRAQLARLATLSERLGRTEASILREALAEKLAKHSDLC